MSSPEGLVAGRGPAAPRGPGRAGRSWILDRSSSPLSSTAPPSSSPLPTPICALGRRPLRPCGASVRSGRASAPSVTVERSGSTRRRPRRAPTRRAARHVAASARTGRGLQPSATRSSSSSSATATASRTPRPSRSPSRRPGLQPALRPRAARASARPTSSTRSATTCARTASGVEVRYTTVEAFTNAFVTAYDRWHRARSRSATATPTSCSSTTSSSSQRRPDRGGVLPHLQRPLRRRQPARPHQRPPAARPRRARGSGCASASSAAWSPSSTAGPRRASPSFASARAYDGVQLADETLPEIADRVDRQRARARGRADPRRRLRAR